MILEQPEVYQAAQEMKERLQTAVQAGNLALDGSAKASGLLKFILQRMNEEKVSMSAYIKSMVSHVEDESNKLHGVIRDIERLQIELNNLRSEMQNVSVQETSVQVIINYKANTSISHFDYLI